MWQAGMSTRRKMGSKQPHCVIHPPISTVLQHGAGAWLAETSANLWKAVVHLKSVRDDAPLLYFISTQLFNSVAFYLYPTVGTVLIHSVKPELT